MTIDNAMKIMGENFIGPDELKRCAPTVRLEIPKEIPEIPYNEESLLKCAAHYYLILGVSKFSDGRDVTCRNLKVIFGKDPDISEPCFYNQDWYDKEPFIDVSLNDGWYLIKKDVFEDSRAVMPEELMKTMSFPSAVRCTYSFFVTWLSKGVKLWYHDFVWCSDVDHNGDRIYVGKYHDVDGVNKNGFSIHRHLALRNCYASVNCI